MADAVVVRFADATWGEVPVAFVARLDENLAEDDLISACRARTAGYKCPKAIRFIGLEELPRRTPGKSSGMCWRDGSTAVNDEIFESQKSET